VTDAKVLLRCERGGYALVNRSDQEAHVVVKLPNNDTWGPAPDLAPWGRLLFKAPPGTVVATATFTDGTTDTVRRDCSVPRTTTTTTAPTTTVAPTTTAVRATTTAPHRAPHVTSTVAMTAQPTELPYTGDGTAALGFIGGTLIGIGVLLALTARRGRRGF
jgi:LPXTG-motif cell wall-anchored protein